MRKILFAVIVVVSAVGFVSSVGAQGRGSPSECGIENCHGLNITCGPNIPKACTMMYGFGDRCRQFVRCEIIEGKCQLVESEAFQRCKMCIEECKQYGEKDIIKSFECESHCGLSEEEKVYEN